MAKRPNRVDIDWRREARRESARVLLAETEVKALKANITVAMQRIREWMESDVSPFDARTGLRIPPAFRGDACRGVQEKASEVEALVRRAIGERTIAALVGADTPGDAPDCPRCEGSMVEPDTETEEPCSACSGTGTAPESNADALTETNDG